MATEPISAGPGTTIGVESVTSFDLAEISDRLEIQQLLVNYSTAIDRRRFDDLDHVFTPTPTSTTARWAVSTTPRMSRSGWRRCCRNFPAYFHMLGNVDIRVDGDSLPSSTICFNPMKLDESGRVLFCGLWYEDEFVRTADGWRITRRVEDKCIDKLV